MDKNLIEQIGFWLGLLSFLFNFLFLYFWYRENRPPLRSLTWKKALQGMMIIKSKIEDSGYHPEIVIGIYAVGIGGGGLVGDVIASQFNLPMNTVCLDLVGNDGNPLIRFKDIEGIKGKRILLLDDVCNSGRTLKAVYDHLQNYSSEIRTGVIVKPDSKVVLPIKIDFWAFETPFFVYDREWRVQPKS
jgi:hypoxanthine phosphoribosyltransferase